MKRHTEDYIPQQQYHQNSMGCQKSILKNIKAEGGLNEETYRRLYPTAAVPSKFYGLPKIHKPGIPLRPIVSSIGAATYNTAKELAKILKPLAGMSALHVHNTRDFVEQIKEVKL